MESKVDVKVLIRELECLKEGVENTINVLKKASEEQIEEWIPRYDDEYYYWDRDFEEIDKDYWSGCEADNTRLENNVIFKTEEEAKTYEQYQIDKKRFSHKFTKEECENSDIKKYFIEYDYINRKLKIQSKWNSVVLGTLCFKTEERAQQFIDIYEKEILKFEYGI